MLGYDLFRCPETGETLRHEGDHLVSPGGKKWPIVKGVPRFVSNDHYVGSFSYEWTTHNTTQLDSKQNSRSSEDTFVQKTGLAKESVAGKLVLDAGVGAGRFADVLSRWGARVVGVDMSLAVESAHDNFKHLENVLIAQADIARLPFAKETFDLIVSIGVLHHTSDTKKHFLKLVPLLKPGGEICIWVYPNHGDYALRATWIPYTRRIPIRWFYSWCKCFIPLTQRPPAKRGFLVDIFSRRLFPVSNQGLGRENDVLDTFDGYSPWFHFVHSKEEVSEWFKEAGLVEIRTYPWDTAVRGRRPPKAS